MVLNVVHGVFIGIIPPLIVIGISAVTYYMCILLTSVTMTLI